MTVHPYRATARATDPMLTFAKTEASAIIWRTVAQILMVVCVGLLVAAVVVTR